MSFEIKNFTNNDDIDVIQQKGNFIVVEYKKDLSVTPHTAQQEYYAAQMNVRRRQLIAKLQNTGGLFNLGLYGTGFVVLESPVPESELITIDLKDDVLRIDGSMAIAWSDTLDFTVERSGKSLIGSAASGEGLVNVYRGTGRVLMQPVL